MTTRILDLADLRRQAVKLRLYGVLSRWDELCTQPWVAELIELESAERRHRSHQYRISNAKLGAFKPLVDFDWKHPKKIDRRQVDGLFELRFIEEQDNVVIMGPNGVGKTMIAQNLIYEAVMRGHPARFVSASEMLNELAALNGSALAHRIKRYTAPRLLAIDEVGYLRYDTRHADLLYEVVRQRYKAGRPIIITTNKAFAEWNQVFDSAACVVTLVDRLCHRAEIVKIDGESYRVKEAEDRNKRRRAARGSDSRPK
ncbi:MAG: ATP-binding protein [Verrucomicrobiae bacterium]|nr:ATP-binding protein [Verrucomicrobiae bacterium]